MDEIGSYALCQIAEVLTGRNQMNAPRVLTQAGDPWGTIVVWYVPAIPAVISVEWESESDGRKEYNNMIALPAKDEETAWRQAFSWIDDWNLSRPDSTPIVDDSPF